MSRGAKLYLSFCAGVGLVSCAWLAWQYYQFAVVRYDEQERGVS